MTRQTHQYTLFLLFLLSVLIIHTGCKTTSATGSAKASKKAPSIVGTWSLSTFEVNGVTQEADKLGMDLKITFSDKGKMTTEMTGGPQEELTYKYEDGILETMEDGEKVKVTELTKELLTLEVEEQGGLMKMLFKRIK